MFIYIRWCFSIVALCLFLYGSVRLVNNVEPNNCNMTYMFMYPEFIQLPLAANVRERFPSYNLYVYGEGSYAVSLSEGKFRGIPVIYVPGHGGSYRQIRSLGSVALQMADTLHTSYHFNFFALDFNKEQSAFYGGVLERQTDFLQECIRYVRKIYDKNVKIILIGHSMGGVIASGYLVRTEDNPLDIPVLITKAAPLNKPVILIDSFLNEYYEKTHVEWQKQRYSTLQHLSVVSILGGHRDLLVRNDLAMISPLYSASNDITVPSKSIPYVWVSADHNCIVWCKQLVITTVRSLFDLIDTQTKQVTINVTLRQDVLKYHFLQKPMGKHYFKYPLSPISFSINGEWIVKLEKTWRFHQNKALKSTYLLVPLYNDEDIITLAAGIVKDNWLYACNPTPFGPGVRPKSCAESESLATSAEIIPIQHKITKRLLYLNAANLIAKGYSHILIDVAPSGTKINILCERFKFHSRHKKILLPTVPKNIFLSSSFHLLDIPITEGSVFYNLKFANLNQMWQSYTITVKILRCKPGTVIEGVAKIVIPWSSEKYFYSLRSYKEIPLKLTIPQLSASNISMQFHLILDPECSYTVTGHISVYKIAQQFATLYFQLLPGYIVALTLSALSRQMYSISSQGICPPLLSALDKFPSIFGLVIFPLVYYKMRDLGYLPYFLPFPDDIALQNDGMYFMGLRPVLYLISYGIFIIISSIQKFTFLKVGNGYIWLKCRFRNNNCTAIQRSLKSTIIITGTLSSIAVSLSGSIALLLGYFSDSIQLAHSCGKYNMEEDRRGISFDTRKWHFKMAINLLWFWLCLLLIPSLIFWMNEIIDSISVVEDPHILIALIIYLTCCVFWMDDVPSSFSYGYKVVSYILYTLAVVTCTFGLIKLYYNIYVITIVFSVVALHQIISKQQNSEKIN